MAPSLEDVEYASYLAAFDLAMAWIAKKRPGLLNAKDTARRKTPLEIALENPVMCPAVKKHVVEALLSKPAVKVTPKDITAIAKIQPNLMLSLLESHRGTVTRLLRS